MENKAKTIEQLQEEGSLMAQRILAITPAYAIVTVTEIIKDIVSWGMDCIDHGHNRAMKEVGKAMDNKVNNDK